MKTIYLRDENYNWKQFNYDNIEELKSELELRKITIGNKASIGDKASIGYKASIVKTIFLTGSRHSVCWYGTGIVHIGCKKFSFQEWESNYESIAEIEGYSESDIKEYRMYFELCKSLQFAIDNGN